MVPQKPSGQLERIKEIKTEDEVHKPQVVAGIQRWIRRYQGNRFFAQCHIAASLLSHTAFLPPLRMTIGGKSVIMRETLIVIRGISEGAVTVMRKMGRVPWGAWVQQVHHSERR